MGRIRTLKPEFGSNEKLSRLSAEIHLLAGLLPMYADDEGYFNANPVLVKAATTPLREDSLSTHAQLTELAVIGYIECREVGGKTIGRIVKFAEHQRVNRPTPSKLKLLFHSSADSRRTHGGLTEDAVKPHTQLSADSRRTHGGLTEDAVKPHTQLSEDSREEGNREQGMEGNREQGGESATAPPVTGKPAEPPKPEEPARTSAHPSVIDTAKLEPAMCARGMFETLGIPAPMSTLHLATQAIAMTAKRMATTPHAAMLVIQRKAELAKAAGETVNRFWFEDGRYEAQPQAMVGISAQPIREALPPDEAPEGMDQAAGEALWAPVRKGAAAEINRQSFETWVRPMKPLGVRDDVLYMRVPSDEFTEVCDRYCEVFAKFLPAAVKVKLLRAEVYA